MALRAPGCDLYMAMNETLRELDHRMNDRIDVRLLWRETDNAVLVSVEDEKTGDRFTIQVRDGEKPLDVFNHPYAYAAWHGIETTADALEVRGGLADPV